MVRRPTLADVASATGVSTAPVSYVLNDKPGQSIPEHTRERVRAAAAELGYVRSGAARALARGRSDLVLLVVPDVPVGPVLVGLLEYDSVKVVITDANEDDISHNIFYTAITRARENLRIFWTPETENAVLINLHRSVNKKDAALLARRRGLTPVP